MAIDEQRAGQIRERLAQATEAIEADANLSEQGKAVQLAGAYLKARADMDAMRTAAAQDTETAIRRLKAEIFGRPPSANDPTAVLLYRDADRYVAGLTDSRELLEVLLRAYDSEDLVLGAAVLRRSIALAASDPLQRGRYEQIAEVYDQMVPGTVAKLRDLAGLERPSTNRAQFQRRVNYDAAMTLFKPGRINGLSDIDISRLAADA